MLLEPLGLWLSRSLISGLLRDTAQVLQPLAEFAWQRILESFVIQADETPFKYLGGEKGKSSQGYLLAIPVTRNIDSCITIIVLLAVVRADRIAGELSWHFVDRWSLRL